MDSDSEGSIILLYDTDSEDVFGQAESDQSENSEERSQDIGVQQAFNMDLPSMHSYLGEELEVVRGRTVFEEGSVVTLDLLQHADVVLMLGQTLPDYCLPGPGVGGGSRQDCYLGQELEVVRGRTVFEEGSVVTLDLLQHADYLGEELEVVRGRTVFEEGSYLGEQLEVVRGRTVFEEGSYLGEELEVVRGRTVFEKGSYLGEELEVVRGRTVFEEGSYLGEELEVVRGRTVFEEGSYLGEELEVVRGRTVFEEGSYLGEELEVVRGRTVFEEGSYLGEELEVVRGRTVFEEGSVVTLDLLQHADVVLMPGQTLPLAVFDSRTINMLENCISNDKTFGVLACWSSERNTKVDCIGTTAEIYEYLPEEGTRLGLRVKACARQRFRLLEGETNRRRAKVRILPEVKLPDSLEGVKLLSLRRHRSSPQQRLRCRRADAAVTGWPAFVHEMYNADRLVQQVKEQLSSTLISQHDKNKPNEQGAPVKLVLPDDPTELSFWVARNVPMKEIHRVMMLKLNSPIQRLRWELKIMQQVAYSECLDAISPFWKLSKQFLCCRSCTNTVGSDSDLFSMSTEGPQSTFVNPNGYLHETITLYKVKSIYAVGLPSTEFSWFPGYAWTIAKCNHCNHHLGWMFTATKSNLKPLKFWGICRQAILVKWVVNTPGLDIMIV
ncbi:protein cereblon [Macrosteles quadrilineatus]|uniref:protein cereblon n=1 Tax=Macrosteles quadrilineatus TaxID=74068 RepID=UPI0023E153E7|nr:protein cereblon [Macrosteles quadrilineatus]